VKLEKVCLEQLQKLVISPRLLDNSFPTCAHLEKKKKKSLDTFPGYFQPETFPRTLTYAIYAQNIARYFRELFPSMLQ